MTAEELIAEGRKLQRPCCFLRPAVSGTVAAVWYENDDDEIESTGHRCWLTVDVSRIPGLNPPISEYASIFTNEEQCQGGRVELTTSWPSRKGTKLYAHPANVIPPLEAVFALGSGKVGDWLAAINWNRKSRYNGNFNDDEVVKPYRDIWFNEYPLYFASDIYAVLGGWHWPGQDPDWMELVNEQLMVLTLRDSEPWVEAWRTQDGGFKVVQRIT